MDHIKVMTGPSQDKRTKMLCGLESCTTAITILADDDVIWPRGLIPYLLAAFEDPKIGAVGPTQALVRSPHRLHGTSSVPAT